VSAFFDLGLVSLSAFHPLIALLVVLGVRRVRGPPGDRGCFVLLLVGFYGVVLYGLALNVGYLDRRHVLAPMLPLLGYAGLGLPMLGEQLLRVARRRAGVRSAALAAWLAVSLVVLVTLPKTWAPHREERLANRRAAEWLDSRPDLQGPVAAEKHRTAWYAGEAFVRLARVADGPAAAAKSGARFLIVDDHQLAARPDLSRLGLSELYRVEAAGRTAFVYRLEQDVGQLERDPGAKPADAPLDQSSD
jgi:hypothetical protein